MKTITVSKSDTRDTWEIFKEAGFESGAVNVELDPTKGTITYSQRGKKETGKVDVSVTQRTFYFYEWECPNCENRIEARNETDNCLQTLYCTKCGNPIYQQAPGEYGTEKPS